MTDIPPIGRTTAAYNPVGKAGGNGQANTTPAAARPSADSFELSPNARLLGQIASLPDVRQDVVAQAKANIDAGVYDSDAVIDATIDALAEDI